VGGGRSARSRRSLQPSPAKVRIEPGRRRCALWRSPRALLSRARALLSRSRALLDSSRALLSRARALWSRARALLDSSTALLRRARALLSRARALLNGSRPRRNCAKPPCEPANAGHPHIRDRPPGRPDLICITIPAWILTPPHPPANLSQIQILLQQRAAGASLRPPDASTSRRRKPAVPQNEPRP
jgi:multidrug efflux pump subunit AcrA (membrane-fusion protein)